MMSAAQRSEFTSKHVVSAKNRLLSLFKKKSAIAAIYIGVFLIVIAIISVGYYSPQELLTNANAANANISNPDKASVDDVIATGVAASVAQSVNMPVATSVANMAVSTQIRSEFAQSDSISTAKPQIISSSYENKSVISYTVKDGDTINSLAKKYGISAQTIKWANDMTDSDTLAVGDAIRILPVDGILYSVKSGDTIAAISKKYKADNSRLVSYNDLEVSGLQPNTSIIVPSGVLPEEERPGYVAPVVTNTYYYAGIGTGFGGGQTWYISSGTGSGPYAYGNCTLYAYNRRVQLGLTVSSNWGNASSWAYSARQAGLRVDGVPSVGAIMQNGGGLGHVAIVEAILPNGDVSISEMNAYVSGGGWNIVSGRIVPAGNVGQYLFIH